MNLLLPMALFAISLALADETTPAVDTFLSVEATKASSSDLQDEKGIENSTKADSTVSGEAMLGLNAEPKVAVQPAVLVTENIIAIPELTDLATENIILIDEKTPSMAEMIPAVEIANPVVQVTIPAIGPVVSAEETIIPATESKTETAEEISEAEMVGMDQEPTDLRAESEYPDVESFVAAKEDISVPETSIWDSEDAHEKAESAMELMELHYIDSEDEKTLEDKPIDLLEKEIEEESNPIAESTTLTAQTIGAAVEAIIPSDGTIIPVETSAVTEMVLPVAKTTLHVEVMTNPTAELTERISAGETVLVAVAQITTMSPDAKPFTLVADPANPSIKPESESPTLPVEQTMAFTENTVVTGETIHPVMEMINTPTEAHNLAMIPTTHAPIIFVPEKITPTSETTWFVDVKTNPAALPTSLAVEHISAVETTVAAVEPAVPLTLEAEQVRPSERPATPFTWPALSYRTTATTTLVASSVESATPTTEVVTPIAEPAIATMKPTYHLEHPSASISDPVSSSEDPTNPAVEPLTPAAASFSPEPATSATTPITTVDPTTSTTHPTTPTAGPTIPAAEPVTQTTISVSEATTPAPEPATSTAEPTTLITHPTTLATEPAPPTAGPTIPVAESTTHAPEPATSIAEPTTSTTHPTTLATEPASPTAEPTIPVTELITHAQEPATSTAELTTLITHPTTLATETASPTAAPTIPTEETTTPTAESTVQTEGSRTSAAETSIHTAIESISTEVKPITHHNIEPIILGLERTPETTTLIPATHSTIPVGETTVASTHTVALISDITIPLLEQRHPTTEKGPSFIQPITVVVDTIPPTESTISAKTTDPTTHMVLLVTELRTVPKEMFPFVTTTAHVKTKTSPHAETTIPAVNPTTSTVEPTVNAAASFIAGFKTLPAIPSTMRSTQPTTKIIPKPSKVSLARTPSTAPKPGFETAKVFDTVLGKITNLSNNIRTATESQVKKLTEIWLAFKLYVDTLQNKTTSTSALKPEFSLSTPEEVNTWKKLFENFVEKMRNSPDSHVKKVLAAWNALYKFLLSYKVPSTKKPTTTTTTFLDTKGETHPPIYAPITQISIAELHDSSVSHGITSENKVIISANAGSAAQWQKPTVADQMENLRNDLKHSTKKQLEKYRESWMVFKFYLDLFLLGSKPDRMAAAHADFTRSTPEEENRNREMFMNFVTELHRTPGFRPDSVLKYWEELKNLLDSYQGIDAETDKEVNSLSVEALSQSQKKYPSSAIISERKMQISTAQLHKDNETKNTMDTKFARIAYELQRSTSLKLSQFKENWIVFKLYLDSLTSNSTNVTVNYHFLFSNEKEQKYMHEIFSSFVQDLRRSPGFPLEKLMQSWHVLNEYLYSYKGADAKNVITSADPAGDHKSVLAHSENATSSTEDQAFQKSLAKEIEKLFPL